jgi:hypothetical protein
MTFMLTSEWAGYTTDHPPGYRTQDTRPHAHPSPQHWIAGGGYARIYGHKGGEPMSKTLSENTIATLDAVAAILIRCFIITVGAMFFTWLVWLVMGGFVHAIYTHRLSITREDFDIFFLYVMTFLKGANLLFFLFPFIAIKWYLRGQRS